MGTALEYEPFDSDAFGRALRLHGTGSMLSLIMAAQQAGIRNELLNGLLDRLGTEQASGEATEAIETAAEGSADHSVVYRAALESDSLDAGGDT